jgi:hypothetical protein
MKIYLKNPNTLKSRIKKLKQELNTFDGISPSLGFCRDLVAQSLNWEDWNALYLGHQAPGELHDRILFTGRWYDGESNKEKCLERLYQLITKHFGETITSYEAKSLLSMTVWPIRKPVFHEILKQKKIPNFPASEIPDHYLRDNILIDSENRETYQTFKENVLFPRLSKQGGIVFCTPLEAKVAIKYFHDKGERHGVVTNSDYLDFVDETMLNNETTTNHHITWAHDNDGIMLKTFEHMLHNYTEGKMQPNDRTLFCTWLSSKIKEGDTLSTPKFSATHCDCINDPSNPLIDRLIERLASEQRKGESISLTELVATPYPLIIISHTDDFLGHVVLSALMHVFSLTRDKIEQREKSAPSENPPKFLVTGYNDQVILPGFATGFFYAGASSWSLIIPQEHADRGRYIGTEMPTVVANVANIIRLTPKTIQRAIFREPLAQWFCIRNGKVAIDDVLRSISSYGERDSDIEKYIHTIPLKWS